jgi:hypothetical protein
MYIRVEGILQLKNKTNNYVKYQNNGAVKHLQRVCKRISTIIKNIKLKVK